MKYIDAFFNRLLDLCMISCKNPAGSHDNYHLYSCVLPLCVKPQYSLV